MDSNVPVTYDEISVSRSSTDVPFPFTLGYTGQYHTHTHTCTHLHTHFILHNDKHSNISICLPRYSGWASCHYSGRRRWRQDSGWYFYRRRGKCHAFIRVVMSFHHIFWMYFTHSTANTLSSLSPHYSGCGDKHVGGWTHSAPFVASHAAPHQSSVRTDSPVL